MLYCFKSQIPAEDLYPFKFHPQFMGIDRNQCLEGRWKRLLDLAFVKGKRYGMRARGGKQQELMRIWIAWDTLRFSSA